MYLIYKVQSFLFSIIGKFLPQTVRRFIILIVIDWKMQSKIVGFRIELSDKIAELLVKIALQRTGKKKWKLPTTLTFND